MRTRRPTPEHQEAVTRRLALLSAELATVRPEPGLDPTRGPGEHEHTHLRAVPDDAASPVPPPAVPVVPVPGRHARVGPPARALADLLPETVRGRVRLGRGALGVVVLVLCAGLALTCWSLVRSEPEEVAAPPEAAAPLVEVAAQPSVAPSPSAAASSAGAAAVSTGEVTVDVAGKVRRPGIAVLPAGSRVVDALEAAGGARRGTDLTSLNLARPLVDGEQVLVGVAPVAGVPGASGPPAPGTAAGALVNINTADQAGLETLPGVGPVTAGSIIAWRTEHGGFTAVDELLEVDGIGDATLEQLAPLVTI